MFSTYKNYTFTAHLLNNKSLILLLLLFLTLVSIFFLNYSTLILFY